MENEKKSPTYEDLGVSHQKEDVHVAIKNVDAGLYPNAFCKILPDIAQDEKYCSVMHADGAGTKSSLAYMMFKETGDLSYFKGIVQDSVVMNVDDVLCVGVGANSNIMLSNTIGRNKKIISADIISTIINSYENFLQKLRKFGLPIISCGGETADVGDLVRTLIVDSTLMARFPRSDVITPKNIQKGDVIVGLSSFGKTKYEELPYNSGISSNGLTLARHGVLNHQYFKKFPECFSPEIDEELVFSGLHSINDKVPQTSLTVGQAILSPTRTYTPILLDLFSNSNEKERIHAIFHNTGGGQSKCLKFGKGIKYIKDNLFSTPPFFKLIQSSSNTDWKEMYQVFNMGHRLEIICHEEYAKDKVLPICNKYELDAQIVGHIEQNESSRTNSLIIESTEGNYNY